MKTLSNYFGLNKIGPLVATAKGLSNRYVKKDSSKQVKITKGMEINIDGNGVSSSTITRCLYTTNVFDGLLTNEVLTSFQYGRFNSPNYNWQFPNISYTAKDTPGKDNKAVYVPSKIDYRAVSTIGSFLLRNVLKKNSQPINMYYMVCDANAPTLLYDTGEIDWNNMTDVKWTDIANSMALCKEDSQFLQSICDIDLPSDISDAIADESRKIERNGWNKSTERWQWKWLMLSQTKYLQ